MILIDTSVWINHFRKSDIGLSTLLEEEKVLVHPFILGELACGQLRHRSEVIELLRSLPSVTRATDDEILFLIEHHRLMGKGLSLIDVHLLASCLTDACHIWTADKALETVAIQLKLTGQEHAGG